MKFKKGIWTAAILLAGIFLETGTVFAEAGVKNLEGNQMPTGDLAEYTPSKPMELLSGQDAAKLDEIGYEDYFYGEGVCLIEWAGLIRELLPDRWTTIRIEKDLEKGFDYRRITLEETK